MLQDIKKRLYKKRGCVILIKRITTPLTEEKVKDLKCGDSVLLSGKLYTARDAAHKRLIDILDRGEELPINIKDETIYYVGPTPAKPGEVIGSAGPTTSYRMDAYSPKLLDLGLKGMIGKGKRNKEVINSMKKNNAVYFGAIGGAAALIGKCITASEVILYEDLGSEAIRRLEVKDLPLIVVIDSEGNNLYEKGREEYKEMLDK
ncbi:Fe-S-containing hydro-lyase [Eubacterium multiforme]|uniref:Fe-S-containing hydro-lyase n=1 Tax=Eubacterium multiforme TaxID=83339 RepID=UPI003521E607